MTTPTHTTQPDFYRDIKALLHSARSKVYQTINQTMTQTYWEIGRRIVEEEQQGQALARYGAMLIKTLSQELTQEFGKGFSVDNLKNMRRFYQCFPKSETASHQFTLSWSHYIFLTRINNTSERSFYEIEATNNQWSLKELKRQFNSGLYERLQLSTQKDKVQQLSTQGQVIESPSDLVKDPYILEFIGLPVIANYSESELEQRLIENSKTSCLNSAKVSPS